MIQKLPEKLIYRGMTEVKLVNEANGISGNKSTWTKEKLSFGGKTWKEQMNPPETIHN